MLINPAIKLNWIRHHWPQSDQEWAFNVIHKEMLARARDHHQASQTTPTSTLGGLTRSEQASRAQAEGFLRLLEVGSRLTRASDIASQATNYQVNRDVEMEHSPSENPRPTSDGFPSSTISLDVLLTGQIKEEFRRWEAFPTYSVEKMGTIRLAEFWKAHAHQLPLLYLIAMDVLPVQASSVSSERAFSSSRLTCTQERNKAFTQNVEILRIVKHSLHRRHSGPQNNQTLDFVEHIVGPAEGDTDSEN